LHERCVERVDVAIGRNGDRILDRERHVSLHLPQAIVEERDKFPDVGSRVNSIPTATEPLNYCGIRLIRRIEFLGPRL
jgi:hypothetical protein